VAPTSPMTAAPQARNCIIVLSKAPQPGHCKTRLARHIGDRRATSVHRQLVLHSLRCASAASQTQVVLACTPSPTHAFFLRCRRQFPIKLSRQAQGDLGRRMCAALNQALVQGYRRAVVIGTDCADLRRGDLTTAFEALEHTDTVMQPAEDGGYVLLGARRTLPSLHGIAWSSGREGRQTAQRLRRGGLSLVQTRISWDVDRRADWMRARQQDLLSGYFG